VSSAELVSVTLGKLLADFRCGAVGNPRDLAVVTR
jgi:hypothetical protein